MVMLTLDVARSATAEYTDFKAGTSQSVILRALGGTSAGASREELKISLPTCFIDSLVPGYDNEVKTIKLMFKPSYDSGLTAPLKIEVVNSATSYLTAAA